MGGMIYLVLADLLVLIHFSFVVFVVMGGILALRRPWWSWFHLPAALWGVVVEVGSFICPLTPLEIYLRVKGGGEGYSSGFIENYLLPILYPAGLTRGHQIFLGIAVLVANSIIYGAVYRRWRKKRKAKSVLT